MRRGVRDVSSQVGDTLIEVVMAVAILGIAVVGIISGLGTTILGANLHRAQATGGTSLVTAVENLKTQTFQACPAVYAALTPPAGWTQSVTVQYWDSSTSSYGDACPSLDATLEKVTVALTSPNGKVTESVDVIKRAVR